MQVWNACLQFFSLKQIQISSLTVQTLCSETCSSWIYDQSGTFSFVLTSSLYHKLLICFTEETKKALTEAWTLLFLTNERRRDCRSSGPFVFTSNCWANLWDDFLLSDVSEPAELLHSFSDTRRTSGFLSRSTLDFFSADSPSVPYNEETRMTLTVGRGLRLHAASQQLAANLRLHHFLTTIAFLLWLMDQISHCGP